MNLVPATSVGAFGDKFRKAREAKGLSLDDVSNVTKISSRNLQAIEQQRFDQLPGGVFNRGFIRAYAKHLGLNDEEAVTDYLACLRQAQIDAHEVWEPEPTPAVRATPQKSSTTTGVRSAAPYQKPSLNMQASTEVAVKTVAVKADEELPGLQLPKAEHVRPPAQKYLDRGVRGPSWKLIGLAAVVVLLVFVLWARRSRTTHANATTANPSPAQTASTSPATIPATEKNSASAVTTGGKAAPTAVKLSATSDASATQPRTTVQAASIGAGTSQAARVSQEPEVIVRTFTKAASPAKPSPTMTLVIRASENSWVSVTADGQQVSQETLIAPAHTSVRASREIVARIGNAAAVTFVFNGQEIAAQGAEAEAKTLVFDANGMHEVPNQAPVQNH